MKRNKLEIIRDILKIINNHRTIRITPLIRQTNLSSSRFKEYYLELKEKDFIKESTLANNKCISITQKGQKFLEKYEVIMNFIDEFEL